MLREWMRARRAFGRDVKQLLTLPGQKTADFLVDGVKTEIEILDVGEGGPTSSEKPVAARDDLPARRL